MSTRRPLGAYAAYIFDIDGTLLYPRGAVPGAAECLQALRREDRPVVAVTNNTSLRPMEICRRFHHGGLAIDEGEVFSVLTATGRCIARERPGARVHVFGNPPLWIELARFGLEPTGETRAVDYLVVGNNHSATFEALSAALDVVRDGVRWLVLNEDRTYVDASGRHRPGAGAWVAALERAAGRCPDLVVGKPSATMLVEAAAALGHPVGDCLYVGDNLEVDAAAAHAAGMDSLIVLTGVTTTVDGSTPAQPEHVLPSLVELADVFAVRHGADPH